MRPYSPIASVGVLALSTRRCSRTQPNWTASLPAGAVLILIDAGSSGLSIAVKAGVNPASRFSILAARVLASAMRVVVTGWLRSEEHTSELQSLMRISYAVFCLQKKKTNNQPSDYLTLQHYKL